MMMIWWRKKGLEEDEKSDAKAEAARPAQYLCVSLV
jgi:hypothetical protein